jgi:hypothetical protein
MRKNAIENILMTVIFSPLFMWLLPFGSFDPTTLGFYISILFPGFIVIGARADVNRGLKWLQKKQDTTKSL